MAISITWGTKVINVPKADMTLIQSNPVEIRELNLNTFRLTLKNLEDDEDGMPFPNTHNHNPPVSVGGVELARVVEIINGYTVTFEDGQYAVNLVGANSNVGDVINVNQVSVRSANSAGLVHNSAIEHSSYNGGVTVDVTSPYSGTIWPIGTQRMPVNNLADALLIAEVKGFSTFFINGDATIDSANDFDSLIFVGESPTKSLLTVSTDASTLGCEFYDATIEGVLDGDCRLKSCTIGTLNYINGIVEQCLLESGTITLGGGAEAHFLDCWSGVAGTNTPVIDMGGSGQDLSLRNYNGGIKIKNKSGSDNVSIDLNSGQVILDNDVTAGVIVVRGIGKLVDISGNNIHTGIWNGATIINELVNWKIEELHLIEGLDASNPMTVTPTTRVAGDVSQVISGDGVTTTTVTRE